MLFHELQQNKGGKKMQKKRLNSIAIYGTALVSIIGSATIMVGAVIAVVTLLR